MSYLMLAGPALASTRGWWLGIIIGVTIVTVIVILAMTIITLATKIGRQATDGSEGMLAAYSNTMPVWYLRDINRSATGIWRSAETARKVLEGK